MMYMKSKKSNDIVLIPQMVIEGKIMLIRDKEIMLDSELWYSMALRLSNYNTIGTEEY